MREISGDASTSDLRGVAARGAVVTIAGQAGKFLIQIVALVVLARLLSPEVFGLYAMLAVVFGIAEVMRDFGLSSAVIQAQTITDKQLSSLFWINVLLGLALGAGCVMAAFPLAAYFDSPELVHPCQLLGAVVILNGVSTQFRAIMTRRLQFGAIALVDIAGALAGLCLVLTGAAMGWEIWALVAQQIVQAVVIVGLNILFCRWRPSLSIRAQNMRPLLLFGWNVGCTQLVNYASRNVDSILVGRFFGSHQLGIYDRAYQLLTLPLNQISTPATKVAFPVLSRVQDDHARFDRYAQASQRVLLNTVAVVFVYASFMAVPLIAIVLGNKWSGVAPIFQVLAIGGIAQAGLFAYYWIFLAKGLSGASLRYTLVSKSVLIVSIVIGSHWGVYGIALGYSIGVVLSWPIAVLWLRRITNAPVIAMAKTALRIIATYLVAGVCALAVVQAGGADSDLAQLATGGATYIVALAVLYSVVPTFRRDVKEVRSIVNNIRTKGNNRNTLARKAASL